jgi:hypothetical protein
MRKLIAIAAATVIGGALVAWPAVQASSASAGTDLAVRGFVAGGELNWEPSHLVVFVFTLKNNGPRDMLSAYQTYTSVSNGTVTDQLCVSPSRNTFNPDSPSCEYTTLNVGQTAKMTLIVQPDASAAGSEVSVRVCSSNGADVPDPVSRNNCVKKSVAL